MDASEMSDLHRTVGMFIATITIGRRDRGAIEPRSHHDRIAIERRSCSFSGGIAPRRPDDNRRSTTTKIRARSWLDRGPIVARSRRNSCLFSKQKLKPFPCGFEATKPCTRNRSHDAMIPHPRPLPSATISGPISLFKNSCTPSLFFNF